MLRELVPIGNDRDHEASCYRTRDPVVRRVDSDECARMATRSLGRAFSSPRRARGARRAPTAGADLADEQALAEKYAPVVRIVEQQEECGYGEPFVPTDIDLLLDEQTVALRGPWNVTDLVEIAPVARTISSTASSTTSTSRAMRSTRAATTTAGRSA